jgi:hypothetical protein
MSGDAVDEEGKTTAILETFSPNDGESGHMLPQSQSSGRRKILVLQWTSLSN